MQVLFSNKKHVIGSSVVILFISIIVLSNKINLKAEQNDIKETPKIKNTDDKPLTTNNESSIRGAIREYKLTDANWSKEMNLPVEGFVLDLINISDSTKLQVNDNILLRSSNTQKLKNLANKCVEIVGEVKETEVLVNSIKEVNVNECRPYKFEPKAPTEKIQKVSGKINRIIRNYPDITYDYSLALDNLIIDEFSAKGEPTEIKDLVIAPANNSIWKQLENNISKQVTIEGYMTWGFAESRFFVVTQIY